MLRTGIDAVERRSEHSPNPKHMIRTTMRPSACCCCCTCCLLKSLLWHFSLVVCSGRSTPWKKSWYYSVLYLFLVCLMFKPRSRHTKWYDFFMTCIVHFKLAVFSKSMLVCSSSSALFRKKRFMLDEKFQWNSSNFAIFQIYENSKLLFPFFTSCFSLINARSMST